MAVLFFSSILKPNTRLTNKDFSTDRIPQDEDALDQEEGDVEDAEDVESVPDDAAGLEGLLATMDPLFVVYCIRSSVPAFCWE